LQQVKVPTLRIKKKKKTLHARPKSQLLRRRFLPHPTTTAALWVYDLATL